jgi:hypothetical protein
LAKTRASCFTRKKLVLVEKEKTISHVANILGRTFSEVLEIYDAFGTADKPDRFLHVVYWLGKLALEEVVDNTKRTITFSPILRERFRTSYSWRNLGNKH